MKEDVDESPVLELLVEAALRLGKTGEFVVGDDAPIVVVPYFTVNEKGVVIMKNKPIME